MTKCFFFLFVVENFELKKQCAEVSSAKVVVRTDWLCEYKNFIFSVAINDLALFGVKFYRIWLNKQ